MPTDPALVTGRLNVNDYVEARHADIKKLEGLITGSGTHQKKRAFQSLPRVERRRAASHDPRRVPRKRGLRKQANFENLRDNAKKRKLRSRSVPKEPQSRNVTDFSSIGTKADHVELLNARVLRYSTRQRDKVWLPTHVWHRKRAFLTNVGGYMTPHSATQKQYRRTYRLMNYVGERGAMAWDTSFYATVVVRGANLREHLGGLFHGSSGHMYLTGSKFWQGFIPKVGPLAIHWVNFSTAAVHCHPTIFDDTWNILQGERFELEDCRYALGSIDIAGPNSLSLLSTVFCGDQLAHDRDFKDWNTLKSLGTLPNQGVLNFVLNDPRLRRCDSSRSIVSQEIGDVETRSVFSKRYRLQSLETQLSQSEVDKLNSQYLTDTPSVRPEGRIPVTILALDDGRIRLILPWNWVLTFWLSIFRQRHVAIGGQQELQQLAFDSKLPFFPKDFPETSAGAAYNLQVAREAERIFNRKPKSKRYNYSKELGNPFMLADLAQLGTESICRVSIGSLTRGVPKSGARIFNLTEAEPKENSSQDMRASGNSSMVSSNLIGFVTSGNYSLASSKGAGIGLIRKGVSVPSTVVVRNPGSAIGFLASVNVLCDTSNPL